MKIWPDHFGNALLVHQWAALAHRDDPPADPNAALNTLAQLLQAKRRRLP